jgi:glycosyltransferase involved in cell wall biosynthesis
MERKSEALPLLSIVIPTRNRIPYAISAIQSILEVSDPRLELVVQDNSESRDLEVWIQTNIHDSRLRYNYYGRPLSFVDNFNAAVELATGEYICIIGDDDGVNPEILEAASWAKHENVDALVVKQLPHYLWKGTGITSTLFTKVPGGFLSVSGFRGSIIDADMEKEMRKLVRNGGLYYLKFNLPKLYHGIVHRRCLKVVKEKVGAYFGGLSPDIFASLAIACVAKNVAVIDYPLTIPGACKSSGSIVEGAIKKHSKKLEDAPHFRYRGEYRWCELVPRVYSVETIWADSGVAALRAMGRNDLVQELNLPKLAAYCIGANRGVARPVLRDLFMGLRIMRKNLVIGAIQFAWSLLLLIMGSGVKFARRVWNRFLIIIGMKVVRKIDGLENMVEASHALTRYLKENGCSFSDCVRHEKR